ncbi:terminase small subunit [Desulfosediminicola ganghwensis]|uniref:terminase small subunit n=1 Tax=Desulfosediminicola ganghwensis TaxID=2569540 RepID=UPI0010AC4C26|nr:terminase small subunit [Desulfosediminicola ganghwensis]
MNPKLNAREQRFVNEYLVDLNPKRAAIVAGYAKSTADNKAYVWVSNSQSKPHVFNAIQIAKKNRCEKVQMDAELELMRLVEILEMDVADILTDQGIVKPIKEWPDVWRKNVSNVEFKEIFKGTGPARRSSIGQLKKIRWPDKLKVLELIGRHVNVSAWQEKREIELGDTTKQVINDIISSIDGTSKGLPKG